ncbi:MAG: hypothetical protein ACKVQJ_13130 [Pyrinomonadaceae bacterium]
MQRILLLLIPAILAVSICGQTLQPGFDLTNYGVRIEPDKRLIVVLASLEMAGLKNPDGRIDKLLNTPLSEQGAKFRAQLLDDNANLPDDLRGRITAFVAQYKKRNPKATDAEIIAPFISMAYTLTPAPELADPVITGDLPGNLLDVLDYAPLVREFYRRSNISGNLETYVKNYRAQAAGQLSTSTRDMVSELLDYLHTRPQLIFSEKVKIETRRGTSKTETISKTEIREHDRHFYIVPESLAPSGDITFLNIRDDYYLIIPPDTDLTVSEGRRAFLRFVIDPLVLGNSKDVTAIRNWAKPALDELRKTAPDVSPDLFLAMSRSLVAAVDVRQAEYVKARIATDQTRQKLARLTIDKEKLAASEELNKLKQSFADESALRLYEDYEKGSILSFYFAEQLKGVEDSGFDIASSLKEMILSFDAAKESNRISDTADARKRALTAREDRKKHPETTLFIAENPVTVRLIGIQKVIDAKDLVKANAELKQLLIEYPSEPRIYFNIGRVAGLAAVGIVDPDVQAQKLLEAKVAYTNVLKTATPATDKALLSLTYVALARVYEFFTDNNYAIKLYEEAIRLKDVAGGGFSEAMAAKERLLKP